jgi:hypothetical protein
MTLTVARAVMAFPANHSTRTARTAYENAKRVSACTSRREP